MRHRVLESETPFKESQNLPSGFEFLTGPSFTKMLYKNT